MPRYFVSSIYLVVLALGWMLLDANALAAKNVDNVRTLMETRLKLVITKWQRESSAEVSNGRRVQADTPTDEEIGRYLPLLASELFTYPEAFWEKAKIRQIVLSSKLTHKGKKIGGLTKPETGVIVLNIEPPGLRSEDFLVRAIHHEIFHAIALGSEPDPGFDRTWRTLNPAGFEYDRDGVAEAVELLGLNALYATPDQPGFLNYYSMFDIREDQAEVFASLITRVHYVGRLAASDFRLEAKAIEMRRRIRQICPEMDEEFLKNNRTQAEVEYRRLCKATGP